ncbi:P-loop containing nucleoside triphosphate hydrolase protein [Chiua virens]|nr:P-loop containing nucleoside triphosphate hydrolase protein [Chiua virens]
MSRRKGEPVSKYSSPFASSPLEAPPRTIIIFGEGGVGKSSLINLIAGRSIAATSSSVKGCTFQHKKYELQVDDKPYTIWDTAGLDEGTYGTVPAEIAEENLKRLLRDLTKANGIHLLVYCMRASRLRKTLLSNYNLFYSAICRKKVPIVAVVTGLENHEKHMGDWWAANDSEFTMLKMHFDGHACVTTLNADKVNSPVLKQRCHESRRTVLDLVASTCARDRWRTEQAGWVSTCACRRAGHVQAGATERRPADALHRAVRPPRTSPRTDGILQGLIRPLKVAASWTSAGALSSSTASTTDTSAPEPASKNTSPPAVPIS